MQLRDQVYVDGTWVPSTGSGVIDVVDASTEEVYGQVADGTADDVDRAVAAAVAAFEGWSQAPRDERLKVMQAVAQGLADRSDDIAETIAHEVGMPVKWARRIQAGLPVANAQAQVQLLSDLETEQRIGSSLVVREPIGVVGCITPWNYPLHQVVNKVLPAIAVGCTVVLKPSEVAPLSAYLFAEVLDEAGVPPGVFNLVSGTGAVVGEAIASHPDVDMVSFTGSTAAGKRVSELAAQTVKRVALELGGKSANVFLDDADFARAVPPGVRHGCFINSGQTCSALTRMLVPRERQAEVVELARQTAESIVLGPAASEESDLGPLVSATQRDRVRGYIQRGIDEGATLVTGGVEPPDGLETGYFVRPTVFADVTKDMTIAQEEIFGPVLVVMPYDDEEEALEIANSTVYGLAGGVQSGSLERATAFARRMRTGQVEVNGGAFNIQAPFGGYRQSGNGRELGPFGLEEFLEVKSLQLPKSKG
ncbi:aldehyde dehydrogenase family protein [Nocardioides aequoreus]|uniref:aldehyde dehydrogenase family protein n=1 Tax=Nocardioides aequoreus TaxID=397278 RepID=UPI0004C346B2|nr:aldehyde dehydrogenase family protein [Nocardioides aequoreus]